MPAFVDIHSHVVPSGDDGAESLEEGLALCREAARRGTRVLYATPHVWPAQGLSDEREAAVRAAFADMAGQADRFGLDLRLGFELTPAPALLDEDPRRYALGGDLTAVLVEFPFRGDLGLTIALAEHVESAGLLPILAHPERADAIVESPARAAGLAERGWLIQVNSTSLLGYHGEIPAATAWLLIERGHVDFVASDGHRLARPPYLDAAYAAARGRMGEAVDALFDGSALARLVPSGSRPLRSRAGTRGA